MARRLTNAEALDSWRVDDELRGGHRPSETLAFVGALMDLEDERIARTVPGFISPELEPKWRTTLARWLGR